MRIFLDHDRTAVGVVLLRQGTFFSRDIEIDDKLAERIDRILDAANGLRNCLGRVYEQPDARIRAAVLETITEEITKICDGVESAEKQNKQVSEVASSVKSRGRPKNKASNSDTSQKIVK